MDDRPQSPPISDLSPRQHIAIAAIAQGQRWQAVADSCGVHRTTVNEWMHDLKFKAELDRVVGGLRDEALAQVRSLTNDAAAALKDLIGKDTPPNTRLAAVNKIFDLAGLTTQATAAEEAAGPSLNLDPDQMATLQEIATKHYAGKEVAQ
jgi:hypothetical protein